ncbi:MAG: serine/threonine-protein kinase [Microthrixaceae bacterium]
MSPRRPANLPTWVALREPLGAGGTASVIAARDRRAGRDVVVKVVDLGAHPGRPDRFEREARALARLGHGPGVPVVLAVGVDPTGLGWLVLERVTGPDLAVAVGASGPMAPAAVAVLGARVAEVLAAAHEQGVVHGDVSPANVVPADPPVLVDFGVGGVGDGALPDDGALTPAYAAPERRRGAAPSPAADVFGLGATLWFALTGDPPGAAPAASPAAHAPDERAGVARVLLDALHDDPRRRPDAPALARGLARPGGRVRWRRR